MDGKICLSLYEYEDLLEARDKFEAERDTALAKLAKAQEALKDTTAHLVAASSLLRRSPKKAAPSDKMFNTMVDDYEKSAERGRAVLEALRRQ